jgi:plastocyanin
LKKFIAVGALVGGIVVLVFASISAAQSSPDQYDTPDQYSSPDQGQSPSSSGQADPAQNTNLTVSIYDHAFDPAQLSVDSKTTVTWVNNDTVAHTVTADDGLFDSGALQPGGAYMVWFKGSGQVAYHCTIHPDMKGSIIVGGASGGEPTTTAGGQTTSPKEATAPAPEQTTSAPKQTPKQSYSGG